MPYRVIGRNTSLLVSKSSDTHNAPFPSLRVIFGSVFGYRSYHAFIVVILLYSHRQINYRRALGGSFFNPQVRY